MLDNMLTKSAEWIYYEVIPEFKNFFESLKMYFGNVNIANTIESMSTDELQIAAIKIALEAILIAAGLCIGKKIVKATRGKKFKIKSNTIAQNKTKKKGFQRKTWSPTGWVWDKEKQLWIPPDYINSESKQRWKWDEEKRIWIDLEKEKNKETP